MTNRKIRFIRRKLDKATGAPGNNVEKALNKFSKWGYRLDAMVIHSGFVWMTISRPWTAKEIVGEARPAETPALT